VFKEKSFLKIIKFLKLIIKEVAKEAFLRFLVNFKVGLDLEF
jgi:hypothetical protein